MKRSVSTLFVSAAIGLISAGAAMASALPEMYRPAALALEAGNTRGAISTVSRFPAENDREAMLTLAYKMTDDRLRAFIYGKRIQDLGSAAYDLSSFYLERVPFSTGARQMLLRMSTVISDPDNGDGMAWMAGLYEGKSVFDGALQLYTIGHEAYPKNPKLADGLGQQYLRQRDADKATVYFTRAYLLEPQQPSHIIGLGRAFYMAGRPDKAVDLWSKALVIDPSNTSLYQDIQRVTEEIKTGEVATVDTTAALPSAAPPEPAASAPMAKPSTTAEEMGRRVLGVVRAWLSS